MFKTFKIFCYKVEELDELSKFANHNLIKLLLIYLRI